MVERTAVACEALEADAHDAAAAQRETQTAARLLHRADLHTATPAGPPAATAASSFLMLFYSLLLSSGGLLLSSTIFLMLLVVFWWFLVFKTEDTWVIRFLKIVLQWFFVSLRQRCKGFPFV